MNEDVVIGVVQNYDWPQLRAYAVSLVRSGFSGTRLLFVSNITGVARLNLLQLGFTLIDFACENRQEFIICGRFVPVIEFLKANHQNFRYVIWTDVRDVVFQTNPSLWLENNASPHQLITAKECWKIKDEGFNKRWMQRTATPEENVWLQEEEACCGGTIAGAAELMGLLLSEILRVASSSPAGNDQGALNYLIRMSPFKEVVRIPNMEEGFAVMCAAFHTPDFNSYVNPNIPLTDSTPTFDKNRGVVYAPGSNVPFSIVHQYDRDSAWTPIIEDKYRG